MGSTNPFGGEGTSINRPPIFNGDGYAYWKVRMRIFIEAIDTEIWDSIENGPHVPKHFVEGETKDKPKSLWTDDEKKKVQFNLKAKNIITSALSYDEFFRVSQCKSAKEMWDTLQVTHEGTSEVKRARMNALSHEYELFRMMPNESINDMQKRFTHIVNHLVALDKVFAQGELTNKVLRCLDRAWQPKVTAIVESKDLDTMPLATLFGKLQEHEMELGRLTLHEESDKRKKGISLKATIASSKALEEKLDDDESDSEIDEESMALLVKKFRKFFKKKGGFRKFQNKNTRDTNNKSKTSRDKIICHECKKEGHIRHSCPVYLKRVENEKKDSKDPKARRAYIVWDENEVEASTSTSEDDESANLCLMVNNNEGASSSNESNENSSSKEVYDSNSDSDSDNSPTYDVLYSAYVELHEELKKLAKVCAARKRLILLHERKVLELQKMVDELKLQNETLDLIYANASCDCASKLTVLADCENCKNVEKENLDLKDKLANFSKGKNTLDDLLSRQRNHFQRSGLGYTKAKKKTYRKVGNFSNVLNAKTPTCFYCGLHGHTSNVCDIKLHGVPKGTYVWIIKGQDPYANLKGPKTVWVPKKGE